MPHGLNGRLATLASEETLKTTMTRMASAATLGLAAAALAACGSTAASAGSTTNSTNSTASSASGAAQAVVAKYSQAAKPGKIAAIKNMPDLHGKTVWWVPISNTVPIIAATGNGLQEALQKAGATMHTCDGNFVPTAIANCMSQAASQGAAAVVTGFFDYSMVPTAFQNLVSHKIPTLVFSESPSGGASDGQYLAFQPDEGMVDTRAYLPADWAIADGGQNTTILSLRMTDSSVTQQMETTLAAEVKKNCPACGFKETDISTANLDRAPSAISAALVSDPDIKYIVVPLDTDLPQVISGVNSAGKQGKVKIVAVGASTSGLQAVKSGTLAADVSDDPEFVGWSAADGLFRLMAGESVPPVGLGTMKIFTQQNVQSLSLTDAGFRTSDWYDGNGWTQQFLTAWGVK